MRLAVTGRTGQIATALHRAGPGRGIKVILVGRPELDLADPATILPALRAARPDAIVSAAAWTAVDKAEAEADAAHRINVDGARAVAEAAASLAVPLIHLSTDYVFDGLKGAPYVESDAPNPLGVYGRSKRDGEAAVAVAHANHLILRAGWIHGPDGTNFVRTMLALAETRSEIAVVADRFGTPTAAPHLADAILTLADRLSHDPSPAVRGLFHLPAGGAASWADLAEATMAEARRLGLPAAAIRHIPASAYTTPAARPADSRLDGSRIKAIHGITLPHWRDGLAATMAALAHPTETP